MSVADQPSAMKSRHPVASEFAAGWLTLLTATAAYGTGSPLFMYTANLFVIPIQTVTGWSRGDIALGISITLIVNAIAMPLVGSLADRYGARVVCIISVLGYGGCCLLLAAIPLGLSGYYAFMFLIALFFPGTSAIVFARLIAVRFERARGTALAIMYSGTAIILAVLAPIMTRSMTLHYKSGFVILAAMALAFGLPLALLALRPVKRDHGSPAATMPALGGLSLLEAARTRAFWQIGVSIFACAAALGGMLNQLAPVLTDRGISGVELGLMASLFAASVLVGRLVIGVLLDMLKPAMVAAGLMLVAAAAMALLLKGDQSLASIAIVVMVTGAAMGAESDFAAFFTAHYFGRARYATILGAVAMFISLGLAGSAYLYGLIYDRTGSYDAAIQFSMVAFLTSTAIFISLTRTRPTWNQAKPS